MSGARRARSGASHEGSERTVATARGAALLDVLSLGATALGATALGGTALGATARGATLESAKRPAGATAVVAQHASGEREQNDGSVEVGSVSVAVTVVEPEPEPE